MKVVCCFPGREFSGHFLRSWTETLGYFSSKGILFYLSTHYSPMLAFVRNMCLGGDVRRGKHQKPFGGNLEWDCALWVDSDMVWDPIQVDMLLSHREDFVSGFYLMENGEEFAAVGESDPVFFRSHGSYKFLKPSDLPKRRSLLALDYCGFGFCVTSRRMVESLEFPWFRARMEDLGGGIVGESMEDFAFCRAVQEKGFKVWGDTGCVVGHLKNRILIPNS